MSNCLCQKIKNGSYYLILKHIKKIIEIKKTIWRKLRENNCMLYEHVYKNICKEYKMAVRKFKIESAKKFCKNKNTKSFFNFINKTWSIKL